MSNTNGKKSDATKNGGNEINKDKDSTNKIVNDKEMYLENLRKNDEQRKKDSPWFSM
jgi:hypothetical protein